MFYSEDLDDLDSKSDVIPTLFNDSEEVTERKVKKFGRINDQNRTFKFLQKIYNQVRPHVWRFLDDRKSSAAASVTLFLLILIVLHLYINKNKFKLLSRCIFGFRLFSLLSRFLTL
jgi:hypothetical protein